MNLINLNENKDGVVQINSDVYVGRVDNLIDMLAGFANEEATVLFWENFNAEKLFSENHNGKLEKIHIESAHNYLSKIENLIDFVRENGIGTDAILYVDIGPDYSDCISTVYVAETAFR